MEKFLEVGDKVRILDAGGIMYGYTTFNTGDIVEVVNHDSDGWPRVKGSKRDKPLLIGPSEYKYIEKIDATETGETAMNVGDKYEWLGESGNFFTKGNPYQVERVLRHGDAYFTDNRGGGHEISSDFLAANFRKVIEKKEEESTLTTLSVGTKVEIIANATLHRFNVGDKGVIYADIRRGINPYRFERNDGTKGSNDYVATYEVKVIEEEPTVAEEVSSVRGYAIGDTIEVTDVRKIAVAFDIQDGGKYEVVDLQFAGARYSEDGIIIIDDAYDRFSITVSEFDGIRKVEDSQPAKDDRLPLGEYLVTSVGKCMCGFEVGNIVQLVEDEGEEEGGHPYRIRHEEGYHGYANSANLEPIKATSVGKLTVDLSTTREVAELEARVAALESEVAELKGESTPTVAEDLSDKIHFTPEETGFVVGDYVKVIESKYGLHRFKLGELGTVTGYYQGNGYVVIENEGKKEHMHPTQITKVGKVARAPKSANQLRAEAIQAAKDFVAHVQLVSDNGENMEDGNKYFRHFLTTSDFFVDEAKRTVVAVIRFARGDKRVVSRGIAKCHPDDVFNADIGKAIAIARAYALELPKELRSIPEPTEIVAGMRVRNTGSAGGTYRVDGVEDGRKVRIRKGERFEGMHFTLNYAEIVADTDAEYPEVVA